MLLIIVTNDQPFSKPSGNFSGTWFPWHCETHHSVPLPSRSPTLASVKPCWFCSLSTSDSISCILAIYQWRLGCSTMDPKYLFYLWLHCSGPQLLYLPHDILNSALRRISRVPVYTHLVVPQTLFPIQFYFCQMAPRNCSNQNFRVLLEYFSFVLSISIELSVLTMLFLKGLEKY